MIGDSYSKSAHSGVEWTAKCLAAMAADKLALDLALVLPGIPDEQDACVARLISPLKSNDIDQAHVVREAEHAGWLAELV